MRETTAAQCPIHPMETQPCSVCLATIDNSMASYNAGYAAGYRAAQAEPTSGGTQQRPEQASASKPESRPGPFDPINEACERLRMREWYSEDQSAATPSESPQDK